MTHFVPPPVADIDVRVPFCDVQGINARFEREIERAMARVVRSGRYLLGEENVHFADEFARYVGAPHCVPVASGLDALRLALRAWITLGRLQAGDEVIVPANSFVASALAVIDAGLLPAFADVDSESMCLSAAAVEAAITPRTRAVMVVHLYGQVSDIDAIRHLCDAHELLMLEDAAQAHGAVGDRGRAGVLGDAAAFSFYPSKNLGALGDAGCVVTRDAALAGRVGVMGNYGAIRRYEHAYLGTNSRMDELQAAVLRIKLPLLDRDNCRRREIAEKYNAEIGNPLLRLPASPPEPKAHVWHLYVVRTEARADLSRHLAECGVETSIHYPRAIHRQAPFAGRFGNMKLPVAEALQDAVLSLPISQVMTDSQVGIVIEAINRWRGRETMSI